MLGHDPFYHRTIRKHVTLFGALFDDITLVRQTYAGTPKERQKVPIIYAPKEKFITRLQSDPNLTKSILTTLPRMSFEMTSIQYDQTRKQQSTIRHRASNLLTPSAPQSQYIGVPYTFNFVLNLYVRNIEDGLQIVEQILPFFLPDYTISAQVSQELNIVKDIPIILTGVQQNINYDGPFADGTRLIIWEMTFTMKSYIFGPVSNTAIIVGVSANTANANAVVTGGVTVNVYDDVNNIPLQEVILTGGNTKYREGEMVLDTDQRITGIVFTWTPSTNTILLTQTTGVLAVNTSLWGMESGAHWIVQSVNVTNLKEVGVVVYQNPITAGANDDFGYTTHITEFPGTLS